MKRIKRIISNSEFKDKNTINIKDLIKSLVISIIMCGSIICAINPKMFRDILWIVMHI
jgi:hypothetical protein